MTMLFREFNIIAAAAYAAEHAADLTLCTTPLWDEQAEEVQKSYMLAVMAIARGESTTMGDVFQATAKAILEFNGGQGGLALEELANIGGAVLNLELLTEEQVADRNIRETVVELLEELAERRQGGNARGAGPAYTDRDLRATALSVAVEQTARAKDAGKQYTPSVVEAAAQFYAFLAKGGEQTSWIRATALHHASSVLDPGLRPLAVTLVAEDFLTFLEPPQPDADPGEQVNGSADLAEHEPQTVSVQ